MVSIIVLFVFLDYNGFSIPWWLWGILGVETFTNFVLKEIDKKNKI